MAPPAKLPFLSLVRTMGLAALLALPMGAQIPEKPYTDSLSSETQARLGIEKLSAEELAALNRLISAELKLARQGGVQGFAKTFTQRRTPGDFEASGLGKLTEAQRTELDRSIAWAMATPVLTNVYPIMTRKQALEVTRPAAPRVSSEMSVTVGAGSGGRTLIGGSVAMTYRNPEKNVAATVRYSEYRGDRWLMDSFYDGYPYYYYGGYPYYEMNGTHRSISVGIEIGK